MSEEKQKTENKKVYFVRHPGGSIESIEKFLKNRDFEVSSGSDLKEAFSTILQTQPDFVFICLDHPNEKINAIPKLLLQRFPVTVIPYVNGSAVGLIRQIQSAPFEYKLFPPNSGPATMRLLHRILKDQSRGYNPEDDLKTDSGQIINASRNNSPESNFYRIEGADPGWNHQQNDFNSAATTNTIIIQQGLSQNNAIDGALLNRESSNSQFPAAENTAPFDPKSTWSPSELKAESGQSFDPNEQRQNRKTRSVPTRFGKNREPSDLDQGAEEALDQLTDPSQTEGDYNRLKKVSNTTCFAIDSARFSGYLVAAFAGKKKIDLHFLNLIKQRLKEFLMTRGESFDPSEKMDVQIIEVDFEEWAIEQAEFLKKSVHQGNEVAMAFFSTQHPRLPILPSADKDMLKVSIDDIDEKMPVKFNLYIHMKVNQKYVLYTPKGGTLKTEQKTRLKKKGVSDVHFHKNEAHEFKTYQAEKYLNLKITELHDPEKTPEESPDSKIKIDPLKKPA